jgi:hypothetical protein
MDPQPLTPEDAQDLIVLTGMASPEDLDELLYDLLVHTHPTKTAQNN